jgi:hypothetical protein
MIWIENVRGMEGTHGRDGGDWIRMGAKGIDKGQDSCANTNERALNAGRRVRIEVQIQDSSLGVISGVPGWV